MRFPGAPPQTSTATPFAAATVGALGVLLMTGVLAASALRSAAAHPVVGPAKAAAPGPISASDWSGTWSGTLAVSGSTAGCPFTVTVPLTVRMLETGDAVTGTTRTGPAQDSGCVVPGLVRPELPSRFTATASETSLTFADGTSLRRTGRGEATLSRPLKVNGITLQVSAELRRTASA